MQEGGIPAENNILQTGLYTRGTNASVQNDKDGKPAWIISGLWRDSLTNMSSTTAMMSSSSANGTTTSKGNLPTAIFNAVFNIVMLNGSALHTTTSKGNLPTAIFNAVFNIVMLNGSALHEHQISNF